jgi:hypothetical protein
LGLQASSRLSKLIRRLNLGRWLVVIVDEFIVAVEVNEAVVVVSQIIKFRIEVVGDSGEPVLKELNICVRGVAILEIISKESVAQRAVIKSLKPIGVEAESIQGRRSSD